MMYQNNVAMVAKIRRMRLAFGLIEGARIENCEEHMLKLEIVCTLRLT